MRTNPTCPTNTSVYHADGRAIKWGSRRSKAEVNRFPGSQPSHLQLCVNALSCALAPENQNVSRLWPTFHQVFGVQT